MNEAILKVISQIQPPDAQASARAQQKLDGLCKPPGSLGKLEEMAVKLAGIRGDIVTALSRRCVLIAAADNGICQAGVASAAQEFTLAQTLAFTRGETGVAVLAKYAGADLMVADVGILSDFDAPGVLNLKVAHGTKNFAEGPAMTREQAVQAFCAGFSMVERAAAAGYDVIGVGEMGIGNTSTASAVLCALTGCPVEDAVGRGAGLTEEKLARKRNIIAQGLSCNRPDASDPVDVIAKVGGFDIAAMAGIYLAAAAKRLPVVADGFISCVAALAAIRLCPDVKGYVFLSHASAEPGTAALMRALDMEPPLRLDMRLGEGSGCPVAFLLLDCACAVIRDMAPLNLADVGEEYTKTVLKQG